MVTIADCEKCGLETLTILMPHVVVPDPEDTAPRELTAAEARGLTPTSALLCVDCISGLMHAMIADAKAGGFLQ